MDTDRIRVAANLAFAGGQLLLPPLLFAGGFEAAVARGPAAAEPNPATPAGYAFVVWAPIYAGAAAYAVLQALPRNRRDPLFRRIGWLTATGYLLCCAWLAFARFGPLWATVPVIAGMLATIGLAFVRACDARPHASRGRRFLVVAPLALYAGWLSAATYVNAADVLPGYGFARLGLSADAFGVLVVGLAGTTALAVAARTGGYLPYVAAVLWALAAIVVANGAPRADEPVSLGAALAGATLVVGSAFAALRRRRAPGLRP